MIAYGYVRVAEGDEEDADRLEDVIKSFAEVEGYMVKEVFVDKGTFHGDVIRPSFQRLVDDLTTSEEKANVVVPNFDHLSPFPVTRMALLAKLASLSTGVVEVEPKAAAVKVGLSVRAG